MKWHNGRFFIFVYVFEMHSKPSSFVFRSMDLHVIKDRSLTVTMRNSVKFQIILHKMWKQHPYHQDYLGFYTLDSHLLSNSVHGLLGNFRDVFENRLIISKSIYDMRVSFYILDVVLCQQINVQKDV